MTQTPTNRSGSLIDQNLRRAFQEIEEEELPDRFRDLLSKLQAGETVTPSDPEGDE